MVRRVLAAAALLVTTTLPAQQAGIDPGTPLPIDPKVKIGTLPNGLRYYIRANPQPAKRVELRLAVNTGGIMEDDDQLGMAHVIEHMGFNGTTHFKKNEMIDYLRSIGVRFGADLNAGTGTDETVYILTVPTDTARLVASGILVLADWAHGQLFDSTEVANERGVVLEEWRVGKGASDRMFHKVAPIIYKDSRYATRDVIGTEQSIMSSTPALLRRFYNDWYRPDLEAVAVVGDIDPAEIEALIKKEFASIPRVANPRPRTLYDVPDNKEPLIGIASDKEAQGTQIQIAFKTPHHDTRTVADYRTNLAASLVGAMLRARLTEISRTPDAAFTVAFASKGGFTRTRDAFTLLALAKEGAAERAMESVLTEVRRADQSGFLQAELDRAKQTTLRSYEQRYTDREKTPSAAFVNQYVGNFLSHAPIPGIEYEYPLVQQLLPGITLQEINRLTSEWITDENRIVEVFAPEKPGVHTPTVAEILAVFDRVSKATVTAYTENVSNDPLVQRLLPRGRVVGASTSSVTGITEWKLSNGARVLIKPTDFRADQLFFGAYSLGGTSLTSDADFMSARMAAQIVQLGGVGAFNRNDLTKKLAGKVANVNAYINETSEGLQGTASPKDVETLLQLTYLQFTAPRLDSSAFQAFKNQQLTGLANRGASPEATFSDTFAVTMAQHHWRARPLTLETLSEVRPDRAYQIFKDRFANAGGFTFAFVGTIDTVALRPLAEQYLASLPTTGRAETWKDVGIRPPAGVVEKVVRKGTEPKSLSYLVFTGPMDYSDQSSFAIRALVEVARGKILDVLREQMSGTYSPNISGTASKVPVPHYSINITFSSSPDNAEKLSRAALAIIDTLQRVGPLQAEVDKVREQMIRVREVDLKQNTFWIVNMMSRGESGEDLAGLLGPYDEMIKNLTPAQIQAAARRYFNTANYAHVVLMPESGPVRP